MITALKIYTNAVMHIGSEGNNNSKNRTRAIINRSWVLKVQKGKIRSF